MSYAEYTSVPVDRSRAEVEKILTRYGADSVSSGFSPEKAVIMFRMKERMIRIDLPLPKLEGETPTWARKKGYYYSADKHAQETRRRWRALVLYVKAKLESIESNIVSFDTAFMAHIMLPNRQTAGEFLAPQIEAAYKNGEMPKQLPGY